MNCYGKHRTREETKPGHWETVTITCGAEITNGLALCELCQRKAVVDLEFLPVYFRNLVRWRPGGSGRSVPGSREPKSIGTNEDRVSRATDEAGNMLTTWARTLADDRPEALGVQPAEAIFSDLRNMAEADAIAWLCQGFERHLTSVATLGWCGEFVADLAEHEQTLARLTMQAVPGWYAGACRQCTADTFVVPGLTWVTCGYCGTTSFARDHVDIVLNEATDWIAPPMRLAEAIVALIDGELSVARLHKRISKWGETRTVKRKAPDGTEKTVTYPARLTAHRRIDGDGDPVGPKRYRLGDVLDALSTDGATRLDAPVLQAAAS